jgi:nicotinamidase-related amidase
MSGTVAGTTPYSWPYDGRLDPRRLALVVVLPGPDQAEPAADGAAAAPDSALGRVGVLAGTMFAVGGVVVVVTTTSPPRRRPELVPAPRRAANLGVRGPAHRITSGGIDGFFASSLDADLRALGRDQLVLCGQWLETGVHSTMRSANDRGYECLLALDACIPFDPDLVAAARSQVEMSGGIFGAVGDTAAVLAALHAVSSPDPNSPERTLA